MSGKKLHWEILSLTRFLLALIVMVGHLKTYANIGFLDWYVSFGPFEAILGFLLISGFSIGKSIAKNQDSYFKRRLQRIYPVYLASIVLQLIIIPPAFNFSFVIFLILNILFLNQIFTKSSFVGPAWTLATEVWLYSLAPLFLKLGFRNLFIIIYVSFISYCVYTCGQTLYHWKYYAWTQYGINLLFLAFIWVAGFVLAVYPEKFRFTSINIGLIFLAHWGLIFLIQAVFRYKHHELSQFFKADLASFILKLICLAFVYFIVVYNHKVPVFSASTNKIFHLLGNVSYPMYLAHSTVFHFLKERGIQNVPLMLLAGVVVSYIIYVSVDFYSKRRDVKPVVVS